MDIGVYLFRGYNLPHWDFSLFLTQKFCRYILRCIFLKILKYISKSLRITVDWDLHPKGFFNYDKKIYLTHEKHDWGREEDSCGCAFSNRMYSQLIFFPHCFLMNQSTQQKITTPISGHPWLCNKIFCFVLFTAWG